MQALGSEYLRSRFLKKKSKWPILKISQIGPWVSRIDGWEGHWCIWYMVVRLSDISSKTAKNHKKWIFSLLAYVRQLHGHIHWATSMPFASINPTNPRTNLWNFHEKIFRIDDFEISVFLSRPFDFFFKRKKTFCFIPMKISPNGRMVE